MDRKSADEPHTAKPTVFDIQKCAILCGPPPPISAWCEKLLGSPKNVPSLSGRDPPHTRGPKTKQSFFSEKRNSRSLREGVSNTEYTHHEMLGMLARGPHSKTESLPAGASKNHMSGLNLLRIAHRGFLFLRPYDVKVPQRMLFLEDLFSFSLVSPRLPTPRNFHFVRSADFHFPGLRLILSA